MLRSIKIALYALIIISASLFSAPYYLVLKSFLSKQIIYSPCFILLTTFCIFKKHHFDDLKKLTEKESKLVTAVQKDTPVSIIEPKDCISCIITPLVTSATGATAAPPTETVTSHSSMPSYISSLPSSVSVPLPSALALPVDKENVNTDTNLTEEWTIVTEKKKKPTAAVSIKPKKTKINNKNNNKHKSRNITAKKGNNNTPNNKVVSPIPVYFVKEECSLVKKNEHDLIKKEHNLMKKEHNLIKKERNLIKNEDILVKQRPSSLLKKELNLNKGEESFEKEQVSFVKEEISPSVKEEHDDIPFLSDNESMAESIESDCHQPKYYSPFSTGFDFGVFPLLKPTKPQAQEPLTINSRLDEYLSSQQTNYKQLQYTQKNSILNLLIQSDQVETTITPTCFKYFDDMMMSTSLYPTNDNISFSSINKRDWDSFSR